MRTESFKGTLLAVLTVASLIAPASLLFSRASAQSNPDNAIIARGDTNTYNVNLSGDPPWRWYAAGDRPPIMVAKRVENGAVVATGTVATCRNERWNPDVSGYENFDVLLDKAFQWMVPGAENVLWYEGYDVYNTSLQCSQLIAALENLGYSVTPDSTRPITSDLLTPYDILIIPQLQFGEKNTGGDPTQLPDADVEAIENFVKGGKGLLIMEQCDDYGHNYYKVQNKILRAFDFGVYFQSDEVRDPNFSPQDRFDADVENVEFGEDYRAAIGGDRVRVYWACSLAEKKSYDVSVSISPESKVGQPEVTLTYSVTVTNKGILADNYDLVAIDTAGWTLDIQSTVGPLSPDASDTVTLSVTIPGGAENGDEDTITVKATSQADNNAWGSDNCLARVQEVKVIVILHINDIHSHLLPYGSDIGGSSYIASIVDNERAQNPGRVLLLDAGDIVDGAPIGDLFYGRSVIEVMNAIGFDAMTVGNHELGRYGGDYDHGVIPIENDYLMDLKEAAEFPMLAANVLINGSKPFESYVIREIDNIKIGIIGLTVQFWAPENVEILDPPSVAQECVEEIENETDLIIALTHLGLGGDEALASQVEGIDIIIGGHSHTVMWEPNIIGDTKIVQAGAHGKYVGKIFLEFDAENHEIYNFSYNLIEVRHPPLQENQGIKEIVENYDNTISPIVDVKIGYTESAISGSELGWMVSESYRENTGADVGYQNSGGIRNYIPAGDIIIRQIHKVLPYGNKLMSMDLRGDYLKGEFEYGYVAGAYQEDSEWYLENGELIEDNEYYRVATNEYSGTRYGFVHGENILYHGLCRDAFIDYIKEAFYVLDISISPREKEGSSGEGVTFLVTVKNTGTTTDNYLLENVDNSGWTLELENEVLKVPAGENRTTTLTVTIPENAGPGTEDSITVIATSMADNTISNNDSCVARAVSKADFSLVTIYKVSLDLNLYLKNGSKLIVKFYTYAGDNQGENVVWSGLTPAHVILLEDIPHPENGTVENATLVLTDDADNVISTIASFVVRKGNLMVRLSTIKGRWPYAQPQERSVLISEISSIKGQWSYAPA